MDLHSFDAWGHGRLQISVQPPLRAAEDTLFVFEVHLQELKLVTGFGASNLRTAPIARS